MNFNDSIPLKSRPKFSEGSALISERDSRNNSQIWKKGRIIDDQQYGFGQSIQKISRQVSLLKRRIVSAPYAITPSNYFPFKIYPCGAGNLGYGITYLDNTGTPTLCVIDSTNPTDFSSVPPTVNPSTDAWRFWTVRSGCIEVRPIYTDLGDGTDSTEQNLYPVASPNPLTMGYNNDSLVFSRDWTWNYQVDFGCDGIWQPYSGNNPIDEDTTSIVNAPLIISDANGISPPSTGGCYFIWAEIIPDTTDTLPYIYIRGMTAAYPGNVGPVPFPEPSPNVIPIGFIGWPSAGSVPVVNQLAFDHIRRFPSGTGNFIPYASGYNLGSMAMNFRGLSQYSEAEGWYGAQEPTDLSSQLMYPGDVLTMLNDSEAPAAMVIVLNTPAFLSDTDTYLIFGTKPLT